MANVASFHEALVEKHHQGEDHPEGYMAVDSISIVRWQNMEGNELVTAIAHSAMTTSTAVGTLEMASHNIRHFNDGGAA